MGFFKRAANIATWVLIRDFIRASLREEERQSRIRKQKSEAKKLEKEKEKERKKRVIEWAKERVEQREENKRLLEEKWWEIIRERYNESLKHDRWVWLDVERCEIKEWVFDIDDNSFPEKKLKALDKWSLIITQSWIINFKWTVKLLELTRSDLEKYEVYNNWILLYKKKWKNIFYKIKYRWNDLENISLLLNWWTYMLEDADTENIYKIINYAEEKQYVINSNDIAEMLWVTDEEAKRLIEKLWASAWLRFYKNWEDERTEQEKKDDEIVSRMEKKERIIKIIKKIGKYILYFILWVFWLLILLIIIWSLWNS